MFLGSSAGQGLKPVRKMGDAPGHGPLFHGMGHITGDGGIKRSASGNCRKQFFGRFLGEILPDRIAVEDIFAVKRNIHAPGRGRIRDRSGCDRIDRIDPVIIAHKKILLGKYLRGLLRLTIHTRQGTPVTDILII